MNLRELLQTQKDFDAAHGWREEHPAFGVLLESLGDDIVGLAGEFGEFANIVKKVKLVARRDEEAAKAELERVVPALREELADVFVYLMRLATHLNLDLEEAYLAKLKKNSERYRIYEVDNHE